MKRACTLTLLTVLLAAALLLSGCAQQYVRVPLTASGKNAVENECLFYADYCDELMLPGRYGAVRADDGTLIASETRRLRCIGDFFWSNVTCIYDVSERRYSLDRSEYVLYVRELGLSDAEYFGDDEDGLLIHCDRCVKYEASAVLDRDEYDALCAYLRQAEFQKQPTLPDERGMDGYSVYIEQEKHLVSRWCPEEGSMAWTVYDMLQDMARQHGLAHTHIVMTDGEPEAETESSR